MNKTLCPKLDGKLVERLSSLVKLASNGKDAIEKMNLACVLLAFRQASTTNQVLMCLGSVCSAGVE